MQQPTYPDAAALESTLADIRRLPPLVTPPEVEDLRQQLAEVAAGRRFLLQGGDCAERFQDCAAEPIERKLRILLQMSLVLTWGARVPTLRVARMAGQFAKPRSKDTEVVCGAEYPAFRGDNVNSFDVSSRVPDPARMLSGYFHSAATLNYARAVLSSGLADLKAASAWELGFVQDAVHRAQYNDILERLLSSLDFMRVCGVGDEVALRTASVFMSHEGLQLNYEEALTRRGDGGEWGAGEEARSGGSGGDGGAAPPAIRAAGGGAAPGSDWVPRDRAVAVFPLSRAHLRPSILSDLRPAAVVLYDPDPAFTRELEVFAASPLCPAALTLYTLTYDKSVEKRKFVAAVGKERDAFAKLIAEKGSMAPLPPPTTEAQERAVGGADASLVVAGGGAGAGGAPDGGRDAWGITMKGESFAARAGGLARGLATLTGGGGAATAAALATSRASRHPIIVDMRDFRSKLPSLLDQAGFAVDPCTLEVGDYVLCPSTCVERKSLPDLVGSLASGRLYAQAAAMVRHYARPLLLIEFEAERPFELQAAGAGAGAGEVDSRDVRSRLVLLLLHFPALRVLWARSAHATVELFKMLCAGQPPPDRAAAQAARRDGAPEEGGAAGAVPGFGALHGAAGAPREQKCLAAIDLLAKLPGVTPANAKALIANFPSLAALARAEERQLSICMGPSNAARLWSFLHKKVPLADLPA